MPWNLCFETVLPGRSNMQLELRITALKRLDFLKLSWFICVLILKWYFHHLQFSSAAQSCLIHCDPMDCSMPGFPAHHQLLELTQIHVRRVGDAIQPSHPLSSLSPSAFNLSQHQGLFQWVHSLHQVAKVLEFQLQHQSFHEYSGLISFRIDWLDLLAV